MSASTNTPSHPPQSLRLTGRIAVALVGLLAVLVALVVVARWQVGPAPKAANDGFPAAPPPLALPSTVRTDSLVARSSALLATGNAAGARRGFQQAVAHAPNDPVAQAGLIYARWSTTGPRSVERDMDQLAREYPDSAFVALHLGMVQSFTGDDRLARATWRDTRQTGWASHSPDDRRYAQMADDLLAPHAWRGALPVLVQPSEVAPAQRETVARLLRASEAGDVRTVRRLGATLANVRSDPMAQVAGAAASFDKGDAQPAIARLDALVASTAPATAAHARATLEAALAKLWRGDASSSHCATLRRLGGTVSADGRSRQLAQAIASKLCAR